jgi:dihydroneopterin triphosphate diphosphatase
MNQPNFVAGYIVDPVPSTKSEPLYLLLKRSQISYLPGIWQIVTGKIDPNETATAAIRREIGEETGLSCQIIYNIDVTMFYEQQKNRIAFSANFCAVTDAKLPVKLGNEHDQFQWCTMLEAQKLLAFPSQKQTLAFIHEHYVLNRADSINLLLNKL